MTLPSSIDRSCDCLSPPRYSVFICTRNRSFFLRTCLEALISSAAGQIAPIVVIDNGSTDATRALVAEFSPRVAYVLECKIGLSYARNRALSMCETEYIVFLDDDGVPEPGWSAAVAAITDSAEADIFGGPYTPFYTDPKPAWFDDTFGSAHLDLVDGLQAMPTFLSGGNMGWRTDVLRLAGGFRPDLGLAGEKLRLGEETAVQALLQNKKPDLKVYFSKAMSMKHHVSKKKMRLSYIAIRSYIYGWQLVDINPVDRAISMSAMQIVKRTKLGLPLLIRLLIRDRERDRYWSSYAAHYLALHAVYWGILMRRLTSLAEGR